MLNNKGYRQTHTHTQTHTQYAILTTCPWQQWLHEHARVLHCMYVAHLVNRHLNRFTAWEKSNQNWQDLRGHLYTLMQNAEFSVSWFVIC
jgi:hypothetical protein